MVCLGRIDGGGRGGIPGKGQPLCTNVQVMRVDVRLFAGLRELAGGGRRALELPQGAVVGDVWAALDLGNEPAGLLYAVNKDYAERGRELAEGDEVALIPPVSGGAFRLSEEPLSVEAAVAEVRSADAGAIATFVGTTRAQSRGRVVVHLDYEAYEGMAEKTMAELAESLKAKHDLVEVAIHHRVGRVGIGDTSVVIAVSSAHREAALAACKEAIDTLKVSVPLWKKEVYEGGEEWIGQGS
jgi:molybdopterin synthase catalytic subunit/molybdopterin converting factor small subunit